MTFTERDTRVIECLLNQWDQGSHGLWGDLSYQDVFDLCDKMGLPHPPNIVAYIRWAEEDRAMKLTAKYLHQHVGDLRCLGVGDEGRIKHPRKA